MSIIKDDVPCHHLRHFTSWFWLGASLTGLGACSPDDKKEQGADEELAEHLASALLEACPVADATDMEARAECADALVNVEVLRDHARAPLRWGAQRTAGDYDLAHSNTTAFDPYVYRRLYLSTFSFGAEHQVLTDGPRTVLRIGVKFRNDLDAGDYPYPFWHSAPKWQSYERAQELLFIIEEGAVSGVLRSAEQDEARPHVERTFDGEWVWESDRGSEPRVTLYRWLFSADNPHVEGLDRAYRDFEAAQREQACTTCHAPNNPSAANPLAMLSYPNQALSGRHAIVKELDENAMPPAAADAEGGISDDTQRENLRALAAAFAELGDRALEFEGEPSR